MSAVENRDPERPDRSTAARAGPARLDEHHPPQKPRDGQTAYLLLGSNISPEQNIPLAVEKLRETVTVSGVSSVWETPPEGTRGPNFLNAVVSIKTQLSAPLLKSLVVRKIEAQLGRIRTQNKYAPRTIDLDILVFNGQVLEPNLWKRSFAAVPLAELLPDLIDQHSGQRLEETARVLMRETPVFRREDIKLE